MTIIVYRDGVLASDTLVTVHGTRVAHAQKIKRVGDGWLIGASGNFGSLPPLEAWIHAGANVAVAVEWGKVDDTTGILISPDGVVYHVDTGCGFVTEESSPFKAMGSGSEIARGALVLGASATKAVEVAMSVELYCGGFVTYLGLDGSEQLELPKEICIPIQSR